MNALEGLGNGEEKLNPLGVISKTFESLNIYFKLLNSDEDYDDAKKIIADSIDKGDSAENMSSELWLKHLCHHGKYNELTPIILCTAYCIEAQREVERGDNEKAWLCIVRSKIYFDPKDLDSIIDEKLKNDESLKETRRKGGQGKSRKNKPAKDEVIRLLKKRRPKIGWKNIPCAARDMLDDMRIFNSQQKNKLSDDDLGNRLIVWMRTDQEISPIVQSLLAKNILKANSDL